MTPDELKPILEEHMEREVSLSEIESALATVNVEECHLICDKVWEDMYFVTVWDEVSPINGISAQAAKDRWLEIGFWDGIGKIYLVIEKATGRVGQMQGIVSQASGIHGMSSQDIPYEVETFKESIKKERCDVMIVEKLLERMK